MKPHKHAEILRAIADGKEVEYFNSPNNCWQEMDSITPLNYPELSWRIKPRPDHVEEITVFKNRAVGLIDYVDKNTHWLKNPNHYSPIGNMRVTFDGETGLLKSAEVING